MAIFILESKDKRHTVVLAAKCISCARGIAAATAGPEGPRVWRDPERSTCTLLRENMTPQVIYRSSTNGE